MGDIAEAFEEIKRRTLVGLQVAFSSFEFLFSDVCYPQTGLGPYWIEKLGECDASLQRAHRANCTECAGSRSFSPIQA